MKNTMKSIYSLYPYVGRMIASQFPSWKDLDESFLSDTLNDTEYPFWDELEYFLSNSKRLGDSSEIIRRLCSKAPLSLDIDRAWQEKRQFRSAQFEITAIFLIENYFNGKIEIIPEDKKKRVPDFNIKLHQGVFKVEAKAQSGQQHGDKHPRHNGPILFDPKEERDLHSWLFEEKNSSRDGRIMKPQALAAEEKKADILVCQTDYIKTREDIGSQISVLCPLNDFIECKKIQCDNKSDIEIIFFKVEFPIRKFLSLKEIWLCNLSSSFYRIIVLSGSNSTVLNRHLIVRS
jgi:hypothetical protein